MSSNSKKIMADTSAPAAPINRKDRNVKHMAFRGPQTFVTITVGASDNKEIWMVPKCLICYHSPFFEAAFNGRFTESQTQSMDLEDVESDVFGLLVGWMYEGRIGQVEDAKIFIVDLAKLWVLAQRFLMPRLQNMVVDKLGIPEESYLIAKVPGGNSFDTARELITYLDSIPGENDPLRQFCIRKLLMIFGRSKKNGAETVACSLERFLGPSIATDLVKSLVKIFGHIDLSLPEWDPREHYVKEDI